MKIVQNIPHAQQLIRQAEQMITTTWIIAIIVIVMIAVCFIIYNFRKSKNKKDRIINSALMVCLMIIPLGIAIINAIKNNPTITLMSQAESISESSPVLIGTQNDPFYHDEKDTTTRIASELKHGNTITLETLEIDWSPGSINRTNYQELCDVKLNIAKKQLIYQAKSQIGQAYLKTAKYIMTNSTSPKKIAWQVKKNSVQASYQDTNGEHNVVCRINDKNAYEE